MYAPICLFTYNRLKETKQTIDSLKNNYLAMESELFIFSDGPRNEMVKSKVDKLREYLRTISGFKAVSIIESTENKGLANSIISGVTQVINKYGKVIVLEDDLITTANFLNFLNQALDFYKNDINIQSVNGFALDISSTGNKGDVYFQKRPFSWGWATWSDRWNPNIFNKEMIKSEINLNVSVLKKFKKACGDDIVTMLLNSLNEKNDSWYVRWVYNHFKNKRYSVYPRYSLVENIGFGDSGTHCKNINSYIYKLDNRNKLEFSITKFKEPEKSIDKAFLFNFSLYNKVLIRLKLLKTMKGRKQLISEIKSKINIK